MFNRLKRYILLIALAACSLTIHAQSLSLESQLKAYYDDFWNEEGFDLFSIKSYLTNISQSQLDNCSDSAKYFYHYMIGGIYRVEEQVEQAHDHLLQAINLREKSIGILDPEYVELLWAMGNLAESEDANKSIEYYQKALVIGETILNNRNLPEYNTSFMLNTYGMVIGDLAYLYEKQGLKDKVISLYESAFQIRSQLYDSNDAGCYIDMVNLASYYRSIGDFGKSVETMQKVVSYINNNGGYGSNGYVNASFMLASALSQNNQHRDAEKLYRNTIDLTKDSLGSDNSNLNLLYGNYCIELANNDSFGELNRILPEVHHYYLQSDSLATYINVLFTLSSNLCNKNAFDKAEVYNDSLFNYISYLPYYAEEMLYSQKTNIELNKGDIVSAIKWKQKEIEIDRNNGISDTTYYLSALSELATLNSYGGDVDKALDIYKEVIGELEENNLEEHILYEQCVMFVSNIYQMYQESDIEEKFLISRQINLESKNLNESSIYAQICNNLSVIQLLANKLDDSFRNNSITEVLFLKHYGKQSDQYATALHNKGRILMLQGKSKQALNTLLESRRLQLEVNGSVYPNTDKYIHELEN